jgi:hypothetical protein
VGRIGKMRRGGRGGRGDERRKMGRDEEEGTRGGGSRQSEEARDRPMRTTYVAVIFVQLVVLLGLWAFGHYFGS